MDDGTDVIAAAQGAPTWQEKREARFRRWLEPEGVTFKGPKEEARYKERVSRFISAIKMEQPERVPVIVPSGFYPAFHAGLSFREMLHDAGKTRDAWLTFLNDIGDADSFMGTAFIPPGAVMEALAITTMKWPGYGVADDAIGQQYVEGEYMAEGEYDDYLNDPADFITRTYLPRTSDVFKVFSTLPSLRRLGRAEDWIRLFHNREFRTLFTKVMELAPSLAEWRETLDGAMNDIYAAGTPSFRGAGASQAPFDFLADTLRGTHGIATDLHRQPEKILEAIEAVTPKIIEETLQRADAQNCPIVSMPLHKGDDSFMSDDQFEKFYWPGLKRVILAIIEAGLVPMPFAEGSYNRRLDVIGDLPRGSTVWMFDKTDMKKAKETVGTTACIAGNTPTSLLITGTTAQVKDNCRQLIEDCAAGGGYILTGGAQIDSGPMENLKAMIEAAREYGTYPTA